MILTMKIKNKIESITAFMDEQYPHVGCELFYTQDYELVIAVMLSAQTTDISVNKVTKALFKKYPTLESLAKAEVSDIEEIIRSIGLYKNKAKNVLAIAQTLLEKYGGKLPSDKDELQQLPGVGNKTAGVIRCEIFQIPDLPVDTHILRISKRLKLALDSDDASETELKLKKVFPKERWIKTHHQLIHFGRDICLARNPHCEKCKLAEICTKK